MIATGTPTFGKNKFNGPKPISKKHPICANFSNKFEGCTFRLDPVDKSRKSNVETGTPKIASMARNLELGIINPLTYLNQGPTLAHPAQNQRAA